MTCSLVQGPTTAAPQLAIEVVCNETRMSAAPWLVQKVDLGRRPERCNGRAAGCPALATLSRARDFQSTLVNCGQRDARPPSSTRVKAQTDENRR